MKVTFIYHSSFAVELEKSVLIFDYYGEGSIPEFSKEKQVYFLNSHSHQDHFRREILELRNKYPGALYLLSSDIRFRKGTMPDYVCPMRRTQEYEIGDLKIRTLRSTDMGVAFIVETEGKRIYHAGDLNWWHWFGEDKAWNNNMAANYKHSIDQMEGLTLDAAFVPLDSRLGDAYFWGMKYLLEHTNARYVFPMHMWDLFNVCERVKKQDEMQGLLDPFMDITGPGQEWTIC